MLKTCEPQGQVWIGPKDLKSEPNLSGRRSFFLNRVGRRSRTVTVYCPVCALEGRSDLLNSLTLVLYTALVTKRLISNQGVS
jgi:hypothetical protein